MQLEYSEEQLPMVADKILHAVKNKILCFYGKMGAGKTTLIKALIRQLGAEQGGSSPTFGIVNEYSDSEDSTLGYHFDFYRIENETEVLDLGFEDYLAQDVWVFIEWPENIPSYIPEERVDIRIETLDKFRRKLSLREVSSRV